jgi:hypothetical protein
VASTAASAGPAVVQLEGPEPEQPDQALGVDVLANHAIEVAEGHRHDLDPLDLVGLGLLVI